MVTAPNPGPKTLDGTNCYLVGGSAQILIDCGPDLPDYLDALSQHVSGRLSAVLLTHGHPDHAGGAAYLAKALDVPFWMSPLVEPAVRERIPIARGIAPRQEFHAGDRILRAIATPGHSRDHLCFLLEPDRILFSGDTILGRGTSLVALPEGNMSEYMATLAALREMEISCIAPGHGPMVENPRRKIDQYIEHRTERERELLASMQPPATADELVERVYKARTPELRQLARLSVEAQLVKLQREGRIVALGGNRYGPAAES